MARETYDHYFADFQRCDRERELERAELPKMRRMLPL